MKHKPLRVMFIGRWQVHRLHAGHRGLIQSALDEGHIAIVAIRDTAKDDENPYSTAERECAIRVAFPNPDEVEICTIPDLDEVWIGRDVGYRVVRLSEELESISGTDIRSRNRG